MRKRILAVCLMLSLLVGASSVWAVVDSTPEPGTPADNECNVGGVLYRGANQDGCPTLWYWKAGWFLARFNRGFISRAEFPKEFESVLPPLMKEEAMGSMCWSLSSSTYSVLYIGPANTLGNVRTFNSSDCSGTPNSDFNNRAVIFTNDPNDALAICSSFGSVANLVQFNLVYLNAPPNAYGCVIH